MSLSPPPGELGRMNSQLAILSTNSSVSGLDYNICDPTCSVHAIRHLPATSPRHLNAEVVQNPRNAPMADDSEHQDESHIAEEAEETSFEGNQLSPSYASLFAQDDNHCLSPPYDSIFYRDLDPDSLMSQD
jgi:hypothetical protein